MRFRRKRSSIYPELTEARRRVQDRAVGLATQDEAMSSTLIRSRLLLANEVFRNAIIYATVGKDRHKLDAEWVARHERKALEALEGKDAISQLMEREYS